MSATTFRPAAITKLPRTTGSSLHPNGRVHTGPIPCSSHLTSCLHPHSWLHSSCASSPTAKRVHVSRPIVTTAVTTTSASRAITSGIFLANDRKGIRVQASVEPIHLETRHSIKQREGLYRTVAHPPPGFRGRHGLRARQPWRNGVFVGMAAAGESVATSSQRVEFSNGHGENLVGDLQLSTSNKVVILCHGYMSNRHWHLFPRLAEILSQIGIASLRFDFAGNGESDGTFVLGNYMKEADDIRAAVSFARASLNMEVVAVIGHSKGGDDVLLYGAKYDDTPLVINLAGRYDLREGVAQRFGADIFDRLEREGRIAQQGRVGGKAFVWWLTKEDMDARLSLDVPAAVAKITNTTVHTVHGSADQVIPVGDALKFDKVIPKHVVHVIEGADHSFTSKAASQQLLDTVKSILVKEGFA